MKAFTILSGLVAMTAAAPQYYGESTAPTAGAAGPSEVSLPSGAALDMPSPPNGGQYGHAMPTASAPGWPHVPKGGRGGEGDEGGHPGFGGLIPEGEPSNFPPPMMSGPPPGSAQPTGEPEGGQHGQSVGGEGPPSMPSGPAPGPAQTTGAPQGGSGYSNDSAPASPYGASMARRGAQMEALPTMGAPDQAMPTSFPGGEAAPSGPPSGMAPPTHGSSGKPGGDYGGGDAASGGSEDGEDSGHAGSPFGGEHGEEQGPGETGGAETGGGPPMGTGTSAGMPPGNGDGGMAPYPADPGVIGHGGFQGRGSGSEGSNPATEPGSNLAPPMDGRY